MKPSHKQIRAVSEIGGNVLTWQLCDDDNEWHTSQQLPFLASTTVTESQRLQEWRRWWPLIVSLTLLAVIVGVGWAEAQMGLVKIERELQDVVEAEAWLAEQSASWQRVEPRDDSQADAAERALQLHPLGVHHQGEGNAYVTNIEIVELGNEWARVQVIVQNAELNNLYRQTRVYQQTNKGWQRILPTAAYWGSPQQLESRYFTFHYFAQDATTVEAAAPKLDRLYPYFYSALLLASPTTEKLDVQIDPTRTIEQPVQESKSVPTNYQSLIVPSPSAALAPAENPEEELLLQAVALALFNHLASEAAEQYDLPETWHPMRNALRLWLIWDQSLPLARWREPLVHWVFEHAQFDDMSPRSSIPPFAHDFCAHHHLWMTATREIDVPVICFNQNDSQEAIVAFRYPFPPPYLLSLTVSLSTDQVVHPSNQSLREQLVSPASTVVLATFFEYIASTYGYDKVHMTIANHSQYENWHSLIPAFYGVSLREFEAGWNAFLADEYGITP